MAEHRNIGPIRILEAIGKGGMAQVYRGQWWGEGRTVMAVAVKEMREEVAADPVAREMFIEEARISAYLTHANICRVYPVAARSEPPYIVMEWINGLDLASLNHRLRLARQELPYELIGYIVHCLLRALKAAHTFVLDGRPHPIIHRDVSPQNVMLSAKGEVKLMDFGIARVLVDQTSPVGYAGKLRYSPQEQIAGRVVPATDLYAVGAVLHEMVEGSLFRADFRSPGDMRRAIEEGYVPMLTRPNVPTRLRELHNALLQPKPEDRPQSATAGLQLLGPVVSVSEEIAALVSRQLGDRAKMSGSTQGDFPIPEQVAALPDPPAGGSARGPSPPPSTSTGESDEVANRTPTARLGKPKVAPARRCEDQDVPVPRQRPRAGWVRVPLDNHEAVPESRRSSNDVEDDENDAVPVPLSATPPSDAIESTDVGSPPGVRGRWGVTMPARIAATTGGKQSRWWLVAAFSVLPIAAVGSYLADSLGDDMSVTNPPATEEAAVLAAPSTTCGVELRLDGAWTEFDGGTLRLSPGQYEVRWRANQDPQWTYSELVVDRAGAYTLVMGDGVLEVRPDHMEETP